MKRLIVALQFMTRLPLPAVPIDETDFAAAIRWFPATGMVVGAVVAVAGRLGLAVDPWAGALLALVGWVAITGALHLDGLGDIADATGAAHGDRARLHAVLADPQILPRIANFDDLDPLKLEPEVELAMIPPGTAIPGEAALIVLPGSKATIADMAFMRAQGWDIDILAHHRQGRAVLGICGGYQMLGRRIADPLGIEGKAGSISGLGLLDMETELGPRKALRAVRGRALHEDLAGYEMHMGVTTGPACAQPFALLDGNRRDGAIGADGLVIGTYCHGLFASTGLRRALLERIGGHSIATGYAASVDAALDDLAEALECHLDIDGLLALARQDRR